MVKDGIVTVALTNAYTQDKGSLKITKAVEGRPAEPAKTSYKVTVKNAAGKYIKADGTESTEEVKLDVSVANGLQIDNLPVGEYTVTEDKTDANLPGYGLNVTGEGKVTVVKAGEGVTPATAALTNTYTQDKGSLKITKAVEGRPAEPAKTSYKVTVKNAAGKYIKADGTESTEEVKLDVSVANGLQIDNLPVGEYTVTEDKTDANLPGYGLNVTGEGKVTVVKAGEGVTPATAALTNTYTQDKGSLKITKAIRN